MSTIPPEQVLERAEEYSERYKPKLEEMFDVDLSGVRIKSINDAPAEYHELINGIDPESPRTWFEQKMAPILLEHGNLSMEFCAEILEIIEQDSRGNTPASYFEDLDTIYFSSHSVLQKSDVAEIIVVHELSHAVLSRYFPSLKLPMQHELWMYVSEGLAEYTSLDLFTPHYGLTENGHTIERRDQLGEWKNSERRTKRRLRSRDSSMLEVAKKLNPHPWGYAFFVQVCETGLTPLDILNNPPTDLETILDPTKYIQTMKGLGL